MLQADTLYICIHKLVKLHFKTRHNFPSSLQLCLLHTGVGGDRAAREQSLDSVFTGKRGTEIAGHLPPLNSLKKETGAPSESSFSPMLRHSRCPARGRRAGALPTYFTGIKPGRCSSFLPPPSAILRIIFGSCLAHLLSPLRAPVASGLSLMPSPFALSGPAGIQPCPQHHLL